MHPISGEIAIEWSHGATPPQTRRERGKKTRKSKDVPRGHWIMDRRAFRVLVLKRNESRLTAPWSRTRATASCEADGNWGQTHRSGGQISRMTATVVSSPLPITRTYDSLPELPLFPRPSLVLGAAADSVDLFCSASHTTSSNYLVFTSTPTPSGSMCPYMFGSYGHIQRYHVA